jgi:CBS domain-containing protein
MQATKSEKESHMTRSMRDVMHANPITMAPTASVVEAARVMRDANIGSVIVHEHDQLYGIVTDRDLVVRGLAENPNCAAMMLGDICSGEITVLAPTDPVEEAVRLMRDKAIRRLPVVENGIPVGIVSLGDLAVQQDPHSALGKISAAPPND